MKKIFLFLVFIFLPQMAFTKQPFSEIIAFGDSLTDVGNVAKLTVPGVSPRIYGYYKLCGPDKETHFSDNVIWIEILANYWNLPKRTPGRGNSTTLKPKPCGNTWAWGGSEAASGSVQPEGVLEPIPNLLLEIDQYLKSNKPKKNTLYAIWSGADNLLVGGKFGPQAAEEAVESVITAINRLEKAGAREFLIFNMPKLGDTPSAQSNRIDELAANIYADSYNLALRKALSKLRHAPDFLGKIHFVDIYTELVLVVDTVNANKPYRPRFFVPGKPVVITNVKDEGLTYFDETNGTYPKHYLFWDDVHPTTQGHQVVAGLVLKAFKKK